MNLDQAVTQNSPKEVSAALTEWARAIRSRNVEKVMSLYTDHAVLLGTLTDIIREGYNSISEYFENFCSRQNLDAEIASENIRLFDNIAINSGNYNFTWTVDNRKVFVRARYTFVYLKQDGKWMILEHHSSLQPQPPFDPSPYFV